MRKIALAILVASSLPWHTSSNRFIITTEAMSFIDREQEEASGSINRANRSRWKRASSNGKHAFEPRTPPFPRNGIIEEAKLEIGIVELKGDLATHWGLIITDTKLGTSWVYEVFGTSAASEHMSVLGPNGVIAHSPQAPKSEDNPYLVNGTRYEHGKPSRVKNDYEHILDLSSRLDRWNGRVDLVEEENWIERWVRDNPVYDVLNGWKSGNEGKNCQQFCHDFIKHITNQDLHRCEGWRKIYMDTEGVEKKIAGVAADLQSHITGVPITDDMSRRFAEISPSEDQRAIVLAKRQEAELAKGQKAELAKGQKAELAKGQKAELAQPFGARVRRLLDNYLANVARAPGDNPAVQLLTARR